MRVVAGIAGGRRLAGPQISATRPTTDRVREAMFNSLASMGVIDGADVLDLFAGTGACGIEALSRGAARATFVDNQRKAIEVIKANLTLLDMDDRAKVANCDAFGFLANGPVFDIAILDPPYRFTKWAELLGTVNAGVVVCESEFAVEPTSRFDVVRTRNHGETHLTILQQRPTR